MIDQSYINQADLLLQVIPHIATEKTLALKGGTAINLFLRNMPKLRKPIEDSDFKFTTVNSIIRFLTRQSQSGLE